MEKNEQCPPLFDYIISAENRFWTTTRSDLLKNGDRLNISVLVQNENDIYSRTEHFEISNNGFIWAASPDLTDNSLTFNDDCDLKPFCEPSESTMLTSNEIDSKNPNAVSTILCSKRLIFQDEFNDTPMPDTAHWMHDIKYRVTGDGDEEFVMFDKSSATSYNEKSRLHIIPKLIEPRMKSGYYKLGSKCTGNEDECSIEVDDLIFPPIRSAQISTKDSFRFRYGRVDIRAKFPRGDWIYPILMLRPVDDFKPRINIASAFGNRGLYEEDKPIGGEVLTSGVMTLIPPSNEYGLRFRTPTYETIRHKSEKHYGEAFHTYSLVWNATSLSFAVDDKEYGTLHKQLNDDYYLVLGVSAGGHFNFPDDAKNYQGVMKKPWKHTDSKAIYNFWKSRGDWFPTWEDNGELQVEYVRVFSL